MPSWCLWRPEEGIGGPAIRVVDSCEPPCREQELKPGLLNKQSMLLVTKPVLILVVFEIYYQYCSILTF